VLLPPPPGSLETGLGESVVLPPGGVATGVLPGPLSGGAEVGTEVGSDAAEGTGWAAVVFETQLQLLGFGDGVLQELPVHAGVVVEQLLEQPVGVQLTVQPFDGVDGVTGTFGMDGPDSWKPHSTRACRVLPLMVMSRDFPNATFSGHLNNCGMLVPCGTMPTVW
jgi:hypothetical protein